MIRADADALACDMAETYGIYDMRTLPLSRAAVFACGLRGDARIIQAVAGISGSAESRIDRMLLAVIADGVNTLAWQNTKDGHEGKNQPKSILEAMTGQKQTEGFDSAEDFLSWRESMLGGNDDA
mgnify:CR=1 FL=1